MVNLTENKHLNSKTKQLIIIFILIMISAVLAFMLLNKESKIIIIKDPQALAALEVKVKSLQSQKLEQTKKLEEAASARTNVADNEYKLKILELEILQLTKELESIQKEDEKVTIKREKLLGYN